MPFRITSQDMPFSTVNLNFDLYKTFFLGCMETINIIGSYPKVDQDCHWHKLLLFIILGNWKGIQALWKFSEWQRLTS